MAALASDDLIALVSSFLNRASNTELPAILNWDTLLAETHKTGLVPLFYHHPAANRFPAEFLQALKRSYLVTTAHYTRLAHALLALREAFVEQGITVIPFKGLILSKQLYGDIQFRMTTDLDIMVKRADAYQAVKVLQSCGYALWQPLSEDALQKWIGSVYSLEFRHPVNKVLVDLQWDIANGAVPAPMEEGPLFKTTTVLEIENCPVTVFNETITLYLLCVHGAKNGWCELRALIDLAVMSKEYPEPVWQNASDLLQNRGILRMMSTGVLLAHQLFRVPVPAAAAKGIDLPSRRLAGAIQKHWARQGGDLPGVWKFFYWDLRMRSSLKEKRRYLAFRMQPTKTDFSDQISQGIGLYLKRLKRILLSHSA